MLQHRQVQHMCSRRTREALRALPAGRQQGICRQCASRTQQELTISYSDSISKRAAWSVASKVRHSYDVPFCMSRQDANAAGHEVTQRLLHAWLTQLPARVLKSQIMATLQHGSQSCNPQC
jgi:hypothetical protein